LRTYIALLRGINVGGKHKLTMSELVQILEQLELQNIKTYIQSGNVIFQSTSHLEAELGEQISQAIQKSHGFAPRTLVLSLTEFRDALANNPFSAAVKEPKTLHLYFLETEPIAPDLDTLEEIRGDRERFKLRGKVFYLYAPEGIGRSKLARRAEKVLGVAATGRNWRTVDQINQMATT
jgi:uncharacterized protein (DUF1697 family)